MKLTSDNKTFKGDKIDITLTNKKYLRNIFNVWQHIVIMSLLIDLIISSRLLNISI